MKKLIAVVCAALVLLVAAPLAQPQVTVVAGNGDMEGFGRAEA